MRFGLFLGGAAILVLSTSVGCVHPDQSGAASSSPSSSNKANVKDDVIDIGGNAGESVLVAAAAAHADQSCNGIVTQSASTVALYGKACGVGDGESCAKLGVLYMCGAGVEKNGSIAMSMFEKSCSLKNPEGCQLNGGMLIAGVPGIAKRDVQAGLHVYKHACEENKSPMACGTLGGILSNTTSSESQARGAALLEKACSLGNEDACGNLAVIELIGIAGHTKNTARAVEIAKASCAKQNPFSCSVLGSMNMTGTGVPKDEVAAATLFAFACKSNDAMGCTYLGACEGQGVGMPQNLQAAADSLKKGCDGGNGQACRLLAELSVAPSSMPLPTSSASGAANPTMF